MESLMIKEKERKRNYSKMTKCTLEKNTKSELNKDKAKVE